MANNEMLVAWLNDAHAMEKGIVETLETQVEAASDHPEVKRGIEEHLEATKTHVQLVEDCLATLGEKPSAVKEGMATITSKAQGLMMGGAKDNLVKSALNDYAAEHMEIGSYKALRAAAEQLGHPAVVQVCDQILPDEERMAAWLEAQLPGLVREAVTTGGN